MAEADKAKLQAKLVEDLRQRGLPQDVISSASAALATGTISGVVIGPIVAWALFGNAWAWVFGLGGGQLFLGGLLIGGPVSVLVAVTALLSGPSYSKSIPVVVRLIHIRRCRAAEAALGVTQ